MAAQLLLSFHFLGTGELCLSLILITVFPLLLLLLLLCVSSLTLFSSPTSNGGLQQRRRFVVSDILFRPRPPVLQARPRQCPRQHLSRSGTPSISPHWDFVNKVYSFVNLDMGFYSTVVFDLVGLEKIETLGIFNGWQLSKLCTFLFWFVGAAFFEIYWYWGVSEVSFCINKYGFFLYWFDDIVVVCCHLLTVSIFCFGLSDFAGLETWNNSVSFMPFPWSVIVYVVCPSVFDEQLVLV